MSLLKWMGVGQAEPPPPPVVIIPGKGSERTPGDPAAKMFGMENFGNTCYANSVLQALYFCQPFRDLVCVTPDGRPLPEIPIESLAEQVALPTPPPKDPVTGIATPTTTSKDNTASGTKDTVAGNGKPPSTPGLGGPKLSFKRQNSTTPATNGTAPTSEPTPVLVNTVSGTVTSPAAADGAPVPASDAPVKTIESLPKLPPSIFSALRALFLHISLNVEEKGMVSPSAFIAALKKENPDFRTSQHQDAHEFLNWMLNRVAEDIDENRGRWEEALAAQAKLQQNGGDKHTNGFANGRHEVVEDGTASEQAHETDTSSAPTLTSGHSVGTGATPTPASSLLPTPPRPAQRPLPSGRPTMVQSLFEGLLTNETRCLNCNTVSHRDETFLDLSIDIEPNSSVTACLREFSKGEMLLEDNRFKCDHCNQYCDAEKRMKVKTLPNVLALHLKRFKYIEDANRNIRPTKLTYRVAFPLELRLFDTSDDAQNPDRLYELFAIVVHIGAGLAHGHYVTVVRTQGKWILFDDDTVDVIKESDIMKYFGDAPGGQGYVLFYQAVDMDIHALGLPDRQHHDAPKTTIPPPVFPPEWSSEKQFADNGIVYTPYAGTSQAQAAASLVPLPPPAPAPATPAPQDKGKKGLKLDIPATPKFDASATLNSIRGLTGPLTMPTPGSKDQSAGFFSRTLRHSQSKIDKQSTTAPSGGLTSPLTAIPPSGGGLPPSGSAPQLKQRPSSRGKDAAAWFTGKMGKEKKREGEGAESGTTTPGVPATPSMKDENAPPVPPLPPLVMPMSAIHNGNSSGPNSPIIGLGINEQRRPSEPGSLERVQEATSTHTPPPKADDTPATVKAAQNSPGFFSPAGPGVRPPQTLSPPMSPSVLQTTSPISPSIRTSTSALQTAVIPESPTEETTGGRSQSAEPKPPRPIAHKKRPSTAGGILTSNGPLPVRSPDEVNGVDKHQIRGRRMSRDDLGDKTERKWYQRIGKNNRPSTSSGLPTATKELDDDYAVVTPPVPAEVIDLTTPPEGHSFEPPAGRHRYIPPASATSTPAETTDGDPSIDNSSTTSSDERADRRRPLPVSSPSLPVPPTSFPISKSPPVSPHRLFNSDPPSRPAEQTKPKRKLSMNKSLSRLSWFGSNNNLKEVASPDASAGTSVTAPVTPTTEHKKGRNPITR